MTARSRSTHPDEEMLRVERLSASTFAGMKDVWQELLSDSDADPLFMSWPWLFTWWETWGDILGLELALFGVFNRGDELVGLAPFYLHHFRSPLGLNVRRLHFVGNAWRISATVRTEYCGLIVRHGWTDVVMQTVLRRLCSLRWQEMVVCDQSLQELLQWQETFDQLKQRVTTVPRSIEAGVRIPTDGSFQRWLQQLGPNTRLKAYNRRRYLQERGELEFRHIEDGETDTFFRKLNNFHQRRWGKPCFQPDAVRFHQRLLGRLDVDQQALSVLEYNGQAVSVLYDIRAGGSQYNLQAGFEEDFDSKVPLGTLHLGYAIESGFNQPELVYYDLLAGRGKNSFYKSRFQGEQVHFLTVQFARHPLMRWIYRGQSWLPGRLRQSINRFVRL